MIPELAARGSEVRRIGTDPLSDGVRSVKVRVVRHGAVLSGLATAAVAPALAAAATLESASLSTDVSVGQGGTTLDAIDDGLRRAMAWRGRRVPAQPAIRLRATRLGRRPRGFSA